MKKIAMIIATMMVSAGAMAADHAKKEEVKPGAAKVEAKKEAPAAKVEAKKEAPAAKVEAKKEAPAAKVEAKKEEVKPVAK